MSQIVRGTLKFINIKSHQQDCERSKLSSSKSSTWTTEIHEDNDDVQSITDKT